MDLDYDEQSSLLQIGHGENRKTERARFEHEAAMQALRAEAFSASAAKWTSVLAFIAILGFAAALVAILH